MLDGSTPPDAATPEPDAAPDAAPDAEEGGGGGGDPDAQCTEYAQLECTRNRDCFPVYLDWTYGAYDRCLTQAKQTCLVWSSMKGTSLTTERLVACVRANVSAGCGALGPFSECSALPGALLNGSGCLLNDQCSTGYCKKEGVNGCGACTDKRSEGALCTRGADCQSTRCSAGRCAPILKEGEACMASTDCLRNLTCHGGVCVKVTLVEEGEACGGAILCDAYMTCVNGLCAKDAIVDIGQRCGETDIGTFGFCRGGDCDADSVCVERPGEGAACPNGSCANGGVCYQGRCRALVANVCDVPP